MGLFSMKARQQASPLREDSQSWLALFLSFFFLFSLVPFFHHFSFFFFFFFGGGGSGRVFSFFLFLSWGGGSWYSLGGYTGRFRVTTR